MDTKKAMGAALSKTKKMKGRSFPDFGTSQTYVHSLVSGKSSPTVDKLFEIAKVLDVNPNSLLIETYLILNPDVSFENLISEIRSDKKVIDGISDIQNKAENDSNQIK